MAFTDWFWAHFFQEDYIQFYILVALGLIYITFNTPSVHFYAGTLKWLT